MPAAKRAAKRTQKPAARTRPRNHRGPAHPSDYEDEITREQIEALNRIVPDDEFAEFKTVSGPAW
jgi:hypothetical protein